MSNTFTTPDGNSFRWVDADTFTDGKQSYRVEGYNAPETQKIFEDDDKGLRFKRGQVGADETTSVVEQITAAGGYNIIEDSGRTDSFGRKRVRLKNEFGDDLTNTLYYSGAINPTLFTDEEGLLARESGKLDNFLTGKRQYDNIVNEQLSDIQNAPVLFKDIALNEREYVESVVSSIAEQQGLDLSDPDDFRKAKKYAQDANYDMRSIPFIGVEFRSPDRTLENVAYNQFETSWNQGWRGMATGLAGFAELIGEGLDSETIKSWGADQLDDAKDALAAAPELRTVDYKDVDGIWSAFEYLTNNVAMSAPYLITLTGGTLLAPFTGGATAAIAYSAVGGSYAGQVWNDIQGPKGKKEAAGALMAGTAMAVLDRLGLAYIMKPSALLTKQGRIEVAKALKAKNPGMTSAQALAAINKATKSEVKAVIQGMGNFASDNINNSKIIRELAKGAGRGGIAESITEAAQEGTGYLASAQLSEGGLKENFNPSEFQSLLASSAIAGGTLGAGFSGAGRVVDIGDRYAMQKGLMLGSASGLNAYDQISLEQEAERKKQERVLLLEAASNLRKENPGMTAKEALAQVSRESRVERSTFDIIEGLRARTLNTAPDNTNANKVVDLSEKGEFARGSLWDKVKNAPKFLPELYRAAATTAFRPELLRKSEAARKLYALVGQPLGRLYSGRDVQSYEAEVRAGLLETINTKRIFKRFGMRDSVSNSARISDMIRRYVEAKGDESLLKNDPEVLNNLDAIAATITELEIFSQRRYALQNNTYVKQQAGRENLEATPLWWLKHASWDWKKVRQNREAWFDWMRKNALDSNGKPAYSEAELDVLYNKIANNENATAFSLVEGVEFLPGSAKNSAEDLSMKPGFDQFANTNILQNMVNSANQTAKYTAYTEYFGAGGKYLEQLFKDMESELEPEELAELAYHTKSIIDAGTGNYKPIRNKALASLQNTAAFFSAMVGLPLSAISSFPEFAMILYQGRGGKDVQNGLNAAVGEVKAIAKNIATMKVDKRLLNIPLGNIDRESHRRLTEGGLFNDDATIATRLGLGETDVSKAWWQSKFYKWTGIAGITQLQRAIAAAAVTGFVSDRIKILAAKPEGQEYNQDQLDVYIQLKNLGMDVDGMIERYNKYNNQEMFDTFSENNPATDADYKFIDNQMNTVTWYFVNDRIQNPQAYNRPLFFQDPHFQMFVQFNGFISTFTANVVPKLWNDYLKNGSPRMQYNTFAMMMVMMAMAGGSQWLKDYIKFGESTPYLNDAQLLQRALQSSGLLGTGERVLQAALPLYRSRDESLIDRLFGETVGGSPMARNIITGGKAIGALGAGETERAVGQATKLIPGVGPITPIRNILNDLIHGRKPDPYPMKENE